MSTSDAGEPRLGGGGGGEGATRPCRTAGGGTRSAGHQHEAFSQSFKQENHHNGEPTAGAQRRPSAIRQEETHRALTAETQREAAGCDSKVQNSHRFTSCIFFRLCSSSFDSTDRRPRLQSSPETQRTESSSWQVNGQTPDTFVKVTSDPPLSESVPVKKKEQGVYDELEITRDLSITRSLSNGPHEPNGLRILPRTGPGSVQLEEDLKDQTKVEKQTELSKPTRTMLSSTVVTVLAPHWSSRLRRTKRFEGPSGSEALGNFEDAVATAENRTHDRFQETTDRSLADRSQAQIRVPFLGTRRNTVGGSAKSDPTSQDYESKRKLLQTVSLDVNARMTDNRKSDASASSPVTTSRCPMSPLSLDPNEQRRDPQTAHQVGLSSKPTTSGLLLSLRRFNSNGRNPNAASTLSEINPSPLSSSPSDQDGQLFTTHLSQTFLNNTQQRSKPLLSPSSMSYRPTETGPVLSPSSSNHREKTMFETQFFSASPTNKEAENAPYIQQSPTTNRTQSNFSCSKHAFLNRIPSESQTNCRSSDKSTNPFSDSSVSPPRHSPYNRSPLQKTQSVPRRTTLTSTSWWKQVTQDGSSPLASNNNTEDKPNTPLPSPCIDKTDSASPSLTDINRFHGQIPNNRDNNNTTEPIHKGNMNLAMKTHRETSSFKQRHVEDAPDHESDWRVTQQYDSNLNIREAKKPHSTPNVFTASKISRAPVPTPLSHPKDPTKYDPSSFTNIVTEIPTLLNPKSSNTPTDSSNKYNSNHYTSKTNSTPLSAHNTEIQRFNKPSLSLATTSTPNNQTASGRPLTPSTKTSSSFHSHPVASQTNIHASSYNGSSSQTPKFTANVTPLGFERSYASIPTPVQTKTISSLIPTVSSLSKTNYSPSSTAPTISSSPSPGHPVVTTAPSPALLSPPVPLVLASSPIITSSALLTPPATPIITSPNSDPSSPKEGRNNTKKQRPHLEGKKVRRVTWGDSVEPITVETPCQVPTSSPSPSSISIKAPSIFSFLRSSSPTTSSPPLCTTTPKTTSIQVATGGKYRSLSSDSVDLVSRERDRSQQRSGDPMMSDQGRRDLTTPRQERTLSVESCTVQCHSSAPLSLPSDFSSGYKLRYSSPPYSTLKSNRSSQGETKTITPRSPLFQHPPQTNYIPPLSKHTNPTEVKTFLTPKPPLSPISLPQPLSLPFQSKSATQESSKCGVSETDRLSNNHIKNNSQDRQNSQILLVNNRVHVSSQSLPGDEPHSPSSTFVTETLVYSIKSREDTAPKNTMSKALKHTASTPVSVDSKPNKEAASETCSHSDQGSSGSSSTGSHPTDDESSNKRIKDSVLGKSRFFSVESNNEQSPKRSRFALKKSVSTPNPSLSRSESDRSSKTNNKMDQVLNRLRQTFSTRRSDDDILFPWKWKRASQTPSVSGSSDMSNVSDVTIESTKALEKCEQNKGLKDNEKVTEVMNRWKQNRYSQTTSSVTGSQMDGDKFYGWSDKLSPETDHDEQNACMEHMKQPRLTVHSPTYQFDLYKDTGTNQFHSCRDPSPGRSSNPSTAYPTQFQKSSSSPRSPFSPFSSLSPLSSFPSPDVTDDSVFYSPKLQRRRESSSPCEPGEGISLGGSRRSRASTGPPSASSGQDKECFASSYADLKYGIEPGRSFSVSSVLSSRPSGPGRISTGSRFMSVGDLSEAALTCGGSGKDLDYWSVTPDWTTEYDWQTSKDSQMPYFPSDPGKMRSRSLPRSLTRCLTNWSSGVPASTPVNTKSSKPACLWSTNMNTCHFAWDTEGPPTPPPTPPLSPMSRRMSKPPSLSPPSFPGSPGGSQQVDSQSSRGRLPSRGYISSLSTFEESSDCSSDTTTDDEYYLETAEDEEKETEL